MASAPSTGSSTRSRLERTSGQDWNAQIEKDLHRTFPGLPVMDSTGRRGLRHVLAAYACRNPAVGYCQVFSAAMFGRGMPNKHELELLHVEALKLMPIASHIEQPQL